METEGTLRHLDDPIVRPHIQIPKRTAYSDEVLCPLCSSIFANRFQRQYEPAFPAHRIVDLT